MSQVVLRARSLVGQSRNIYQCNHVVNYAINDNMNIGGLARDWLARKGSNGSLNGKAGDVIVGLDGVHCGIFTGSTIIHSSSSRNMVIEVDFTQVNYIFPSGYVFISM